ncbi:MAG: NAD-dependent dehydratase, partial [Sphingobacteriales bacterium]
MKITITGSLGNISKPLTQKLVAAGHEVTVITSNQDRTAAIETLGAKAAIGSVEDIEFLTSAFSSQDAIYTMVPPNFGAANIREFIASVGQNYAKAIKSSGVKKVLNLSSIGAHIDGGTGPISGLYDVEHAYSELKEVAIKHLRPGFFYVNFYANTDMIRHAGILGSNYDGETPVVLVHPEDIAAAAAEELHQGFSGHSIRYVA